MLMNRLAKFGRRNLGNSLLVGALKSAANSHRIMAKVGILYDFLVTVKAAPHECLIRTGKS